MDIKTKAQRSYNMSQIRSENTKPELLMFSLLKKRNIKFKKHYNLLGKPDIAFPESKIAVFINGEFWHGKDFGRIRKTIPKFWQKKIGANIKRDIKIRRELRSRGWHVMNFWGRKVIKNPQGQLKRLLKFLEKYGF